MSQDADGTARGLLFDSNNHLVGHAKLRWVDEPTSVERVRYVGDVAEQESDGSTASTSDAPSISHLVPIALVAVAGIAAGVTGAKIAQGRKRRREAELTDTRGAWPAAATPAGWYEFSNDTTRLRYWNGVVWTDEYAQRAGAARQIAADWYPDPSNMAQLRYWDGSAWTLHISRRPGAVTTPADWYPDPSNAAQLRYWDGTAWTAHITTGPGSALGPVQGSASGSDLAPAHAKAQFDMSSAEWKAHVEAWLLAGAIQQELWVRLSNAHIQDADTATVEAQRKMGALTPQERERRIQLILESNPGLQHHDTLLDLLNLLVAGQQQIPLGVDSRHERQR